MSNKVIKTEFMICPVCMEEHEVRTVSIREKRTFKGLHLEYDACYMYCENADEYYANEKQIQENDIRLKDAYRVAEGLLTSSEIIAIRTKYDISQNDMSKLLGWGGKTITRYESHQVQDKAHDTILKKIDQDPEWFISLLNNGRENFSDSTYKRYINIARILYESNKDYYLRKTIKAGYAIFSQADQLNGNSELSLDKVVDVIRYFASSQAVTALYKVKLMKLLWYSDALSYRDRQHAITGLVYQAFPMGAVPVEYNSIVDLKGVPCEEIDMGEANAYYFTLNEPVEFKYLSDEDFRILDIVIDRFGKMSKNEIVDHMHSEQAYLKTAPMDYISFEYSKYLKI